MAEPSVGASPWSGEVPTMSAPLPRPPFRSPQSIIEEPDIDMHDGPDFVDDWMEKNLTPNLIDFVRNHCTTFARWDLLRHLHTSPSGLTLDILSELSGVPEGAAASELKSLEAAGLVEKRDGQGRTAYYLGSASGLDQAVEAAVRAYEQDREFRFALVYSIVRAGCTGAVVE